MNLFRTLSGAAVLCLSGAVLHSCISAPSYPIEPAIDFKDLRVVHVPAGGGLLARDTLKFALNFRDGDGDLGLSDDDIKTPPFNATTGGHNNRGYSLNYYIQPFIKDPNTGRFTQFVTPPPFGKVGEYDGRFLRLDAADAKPAPLKGVLNYRLPLELDGTVFRPGQVLRFELSILDRGLHESNKITTPEVTLGR